jgi:hypothetical protein
VGQSYPMKFERLITELKPYCMSDYCKDCTNSIVEMTIYNLFGCRQDGGSK